MEETLGVAPELTTSEWEIVMAAGVPDAEGGREEVGAVLLDTTVLALCSLTW